MGIGFNTTINGINELLTERHCGIRSISDFELNDFSMIMLFLLKESFHSPLHF